MRLHSCLKQADNGLIGYLDFRSTSPVEILLPGTADQLNDYVVGVPRRRPPEASPGGVPHVRRAIAIEREVINRKTGSVSNEFIHGITSQSTLDADAESILKTNRKPTENQPKTNRKHWRIENSCHYILDWTYHRDMCRIQTQYCPKNMTLLRRFSIGAIKAISSRGVLEITKDLIINVWMVFDY